MHGSKLMLNVCMKGVQSYGIMHIAVLTGLVIIFVNRQQNMHGVWKHVLNVRTKALKRPV